MGTSAVTQTRSGPPSSRLPLMMGVIACVQFAICAWMVMDMVKDHGAAAWRSDGATEVLATVALLVCTVLVMLACRYEYRRLANTQRQLGTLTNGLVVMIDDSFTNWHLTRAESDVALLALKGFETQEIADMRHASAGTVRAQLARVYSKAGVESRTGLQGLFIEDLMAGLQYDEHGPDRDVAGHSRSGAADSNPKS